MNVMSFKVTAVVLTMFLASPACTVGQTGEEHVVTKCREQTMELDVDDSTPLGIVPADYFADLQAANSVFEALWGSEGQPGDSVKLTFTALSGAQFVTAQPEDGSVESACPDFMVLDITLGIESVGGNSLAESVPATARVFDDGSGSIAATLPRDDIQGTLGAGETSPAGLSFDRLTIQLTLAERKVGALLIAAESDDKNRTSEIVAAWP